MRLDDTHQERGVVVICAHFQDLRAQLFSVVQATYETALLMASGRRLESSKSEAEIREELDEAAGVALQFK